MRFRQFISEEMSHLRPLLERDCAPFFQKSGMQGLMFRGILKHQEGKSYLIDSEATATGQVELSVVRKTVRKDRLPRNTPIEVHNVADEWFDSKFGIKARSQTLFCYGNASSHLTDMYGTYLAAIFPIGQFNCIWSPHVEDMYDNVPFRKIDVRDEKMPDEGAAEIMLWLEGEFYKDDDFKSAVQSRSELMIDCDEYYAVMIPRKDVLWELKEYLGIEHTRRD